MLKERDAQIKDLQSSLQRAFGASAELRDLIMAAVSELDILKQQNVALATRVAAAEESSQKGEAKTLTAPPTNAPANGFPIKPSVKIVEQREDASVTIAAIDQMRKIAVALRNAGLTKQSAETTASVLSASLIASGWVNISGSLSATWPRA